MSPRHSGVVGVGLNPLADGFHVRNGALNADVNLAAGDDGDAGTVATVLPWKTGGINAHRKPDLGVGRWVVKVPGHDADDGEGLPVERHRLADSITRACERPLPETVTHNRLPLRAPQSFIAREDTADMSATAEGSEVVTEDVLRLESLGQLGARQVHAGKPARPIVSNDDDISSHEK